MYFLSKFWKLLVPSVVKQGMELHKESPATTAQVRGRKLLNPPNQPSRAGEQS